MKLARDGLPTIGGLAFMVIGGGLMSPWISVILAFPMMLAIWFYSDPERTPEGSAGWVCPADGKVVEIEEVDHEYTGKATKIGIFMNGLDVHVNRFPTSGRVEYVKYVPG